MGTGIGVGCRRCGEQLNYDDGFDSQLQLCNRCASIVKFDSLSKSENYHDPDDYYPTPYGVSSFDTRVLIEELQGRIEWNMEEEEKDEILKLAQFILQLRCPEAAEAHIKLKDKEEIHEIKLPKR